jgi:hypothetical protein
MMLNVIYLMEFTFDMTHFLCCIGLVCMLDGGHPTSFGGCWVTLRMLHPFEETLHPLDETFAPFGGNCFTFEPIHMPFHMI